MASSTYLLRMKQTITVRTRHALSQHFKPHKLLAIPLPSGLFWMVSPLHQGFESRIFMDFWDYTDFSERFVIDWCIRLYSDKKQKTCPPTTTALRTKNHSTKKRFIIKINYIKKKT